MTGRTIVLFTAAVTCTLSTGCMHLSQLVSNVHRSAAIRMENHRELSKLKLETNADLAAEKQEAKQLAAERERQQLRASLAQQKLEMQFCQLNQQAQRARIRDDVHSKVAFNVVQGLEVGELEVDVEQLQQLLDQRKQEQQNVTMSPQIGGPTQKSCVCDSRHCGCYPGRLKRDCSACAQKACDCPKQNDCGGPAALQTAMQQGPRPLKPTEIPLKLPVRLTFGMQNPRVEQTQIMPGLPYSPQMGPPVEQQQQQKGPYYGPTQKDAHVSQADAPPVPVATPIPVPPVPSVDRF
jgi:hypothetical protein